MLRSLVLGEAAGSDQPDAGPPGSLRPLVLDDGFSPPGRPESDWIPHGRNALQPSTRPHVHRTPTSSSRSARPLFLLTGVAGVLARPLHPGIGFAVVADESGFRLNP